MVFSHFNLYETPWHRNSGMLSHVLISSMFYTFWSTVLPLCIQGRVRTSFRGALFVRLCIWACEFAYIVWCLCWSGFHVEGIKRKETRISVFLQTYLFRGRFPLDQFNPVCIISLFCHNGFIHFVGPLCSMPASAFKVNFEVTGIQVIYWYRS